MVTGGVFYASRLIKCGEDDLFGCVEFTCYKMWFACAKLLSVLVRLVKIVII